MAVLGGLESFVGGSVPEMRLFCRCWSGPGGVMFANNLIMATGDALLGGKSLKREPNPLWREMKMRETSSGNLLNRRAGVIRVR